MFKLNNEELEYERNYRILNEDEQEAQALAQAGITPEQAYMQALQKANDDVDTTGRKRYQKYRMNGGTKSYKEFIKKAEMKAAEQVDDEMKETFGYVPGKESSKDLLRQIKDLLGQMNQNQQQSDMEDQQMLQSMQGGDPNMQPPMVPNMQQPPMDMNQPPMDPNAQPMQDPNAGAPVDPNAQPQQPMQEGYINFMNQKMYDKKMQDTFDYYFG